jgi:two-component system sensor histidine kinase ChvG
MRFRASIRLKLLLLSLALLSIPIVGYQYVREIERHLQGELESALKVSAQLLAGRLQDETELFPQPGAKPIYSEDALFLHPLDHAMQIDGYEDDWSNYIDWATEYRGSDKFGFRLIIGQHSGYIYGFIQVTDDQLVYRRLDGVDTISDRIHIAVRDPVGRLRRYAIATSAPGSLHPYQLLRGPDDTVIERSVTNIETSWQESLRGYNVEFRLPEYLVGDALSFEILDVDDRLHPQIAQRLGTAGPTTIAAPSPLLRTSPHIKALLSPMGQIPGRRVWVLGHQGQVLASAGSLRKEIPKHPLSLLFALVLPSAHERFEDDLAGATRLTGSDVKAALRGDTRTRWRSSPDRRAVIVSAAHPIEIDGVVRGAVMIEETTNSIQTVQREAMADLFNATLLSFVVVTLLLLGFATRLSYRMRRLVRDSEAAIDEHGRVVGEMVGSNSQDEIGDVSRSFASILERLRQYNAYLESMSSKLSHELQTPLAVVKSSLESIDQTALKNEDRAYLHRAEQGADRLAKLIMRLREATRIEQALQTAELEAVDMGDLLEGCIAGYRDAYPANRFDLEKPAQSIAVTAAPDLLVQMLDKLIGNAVDFSPPEQPISLKLANGANQCSIAVCNQGSTLPATMTGELFNSMVSVRGKGDQRDEPHLGLGLYVARLIAEFHGGRINARNLPNSSGVEFNISLPLKNKPGW